MGKVPNEFVPVKYASESSMAQGNTMMNFFIGSLFALLIFQLYRSMHGKGSGGAAGKTGGTPKDSS